MTATAHRDWCLRSAASLGFAIESVSECDDHFDFNKCSCEKTNLSAHSGSRLQPFLARYETQYAMYSHKRVRKSTKAHKPHIWRLLRSSNHSLLWY